MKLNRLISIAACVTCLPNASYADEHLTTQTSSHGIATRTAANPGNNHHNKVITQNRARSSPGYLTQQPSGLRFAVRHENPDQRTVKADTGSTGFDPSLCSGASQATANVAGSAPPEKTPEPPRANPLSQSQRMDEEPVTLETLGRFFRSGLTPAISVGEIVRFRVPLKDEANPFVSKR